MAQRSKAAVWFLGIIGTLTVIGGISVYAFHFHPWYFMQLAYVPGTLIAEEQETPAANYEEEAGWYSFGTTLNEAGMTPTGEQQREPVKGVDVFFIHPTTYLKSARWNAPLEDADTQYRSRWYVMKNQASAFNGIERIYAPRYRQATFGAFLDDSGQGLLALQKAQDDIRKAFETYLEKYNEGRPFILAGHSQGALHSLFLLRDRIANTLLAEQMVAAYILGWPVGLKSDFPSMPGLEPCQTRLETGCLISWQSFIGPELGGEPAQLESLFKAAPGLNGKARPDGDSMLCTNPLTWVPGTTAKAEANLGAVGSIQSQDPLPTADLKFIGARCSESGVLILDRDPQEEPWTNARLPGKNMHVHDIALFYVNLRKNVRERAIAYLNSDTDGGS